MNYRKQTPLLTLCYLTFAFSIGAFLVNISPLLPIIFGIGLIFITLFYMRKIFNGLVVSSTLFSNQQIALLAAYLGMFFMGGCSPVLFQNTTLPFGAHVSGMIAIVAFLILIVGATKGLFNDLTTKQHSAWLLYKIAYGYSGLFAMYWLNLEIQQLEPNVFTTLTVYTTTILIAVGAYFFITYLTSGFITYLFNKPPRVIELPLTRKLKQKLNIHERVEPELK